MDWDSYSLLFGGILDAALIILLVFILRERREKIGCGDDFLKAMEDKRYMLGIIAMVLLLITGALDLFYR